MPSSNSTQNSLKSFWGQLGRGPFPFPLLGDPSLRSGRPKYGRLERRILPLPNIRKSPHKKVFGTTLRVGSERGQFPLSIKEEMSHFVRHDNKWRRAMPSSSSTQNSLKSFWGQLGSGPFPFPLLGDPSLRSGRPKYGRLGRGSSSHYVSPRTQ